MTRISKASLLAGLLAGVIAPLTWPLVLWLGNGTWPDWSTYPMAALTIALFAIIIATPCCFILGGPVVVLLEKYHRSTPVSVGFAGLAAALSLYLLAGALRNAPPLSESWPLAVFFAIIGSSCGALSGYLSRRDNSTR